MTWQSDVTDAVHDVYDALGALVDLLSEGGIPGLDDLFDAGDAEEDGCIDAKISTNAAATN